ncbi:hypothetical protein AAC691_17135 [Nguyenibacter vanlangensis]|uniref:Uncharacterized protein n=1 Tax=Nguyenibacter vanlangensis TaxID=1216886 RepID=A0ABZ3D2W0_9PROT
MARSENVPRDMCDLMVAMWNAGVRGQTIAQETGYIESTVRNVLTRMRKRGADVAQRRHLKTHEENAAIGCHEAHGPVTSQRSAAWVRMRRGGARIIDIARAFGRQPDVVSYHLMQKEVAVIPADSLYTVQVLIARPEPVEIYGQPSLFAEMPEGEMTERLLRLAESGAGETQLARWSADWLTAETGAEYVVTVDFSKDLLCDGTTVTVCAMEAV